MAAVPSFADIGKTAVSHEIDYLQPQAEVAFQKAVSNTGRLFCQFFTPIIRQKVSGMLFRKLEALGFLVILTKNSNEADNEANFVNATRLFCSTDAEVTTVYQNLAEGEQILGHANFGSREDINKIADSVTSSLQLTTANAAQGEDAGAQETAMSGYDKLSFITFYATVTHLGVERLSSEDLLIKKSQIMGEGKMPYNPLVLCARALAGSSEEEKVRGYAAIIFSRALPIVAQALTPDSELNVFLSKMFETGGDVSTTATYQGVPAATILANTKLFQQVMGMEAIPQDLMKTRSVINFISQTLDNYDDTGTGLGSYLVFVRSLDDDRWREAVVHPLFTKARRIVRVIVALESVRDGVSAKDAKVRRDYRERLRKSKPFLGDLWSPLLEGIGYDGTVNPLKSQNNQVSVYGALGSVGSRF